MQTARALQCRGIYAINCQIEAKTIHCGVLIYNDRDFPTGETVTLVDVDTKTPYPVLIPTEHGYNVTLQRTS